MKKTYLAVLLTVMFGLFSCQSHQIKNKLCGTWVYTGESVASVTFTDNNTFYTGGRLDSDGRYEIDGKDIIVYYSQGGSCNLRIAEDGCLYADDGSRYVKISDDVNTKQHTHNTKQKTISTTEDWINFVSATDDIEKINGVLTSMKPSRIIQMTKELSEMVSNSNTNEPQARAKCRALIYILIIPGPHQVLKERDKYTGFCFSDSEYDEFNRIFDDAPRRKALSVLGNKEANKIFDSFEEWAKTLH